MRNFIEQRQVLFQKMARIDQMEYGSLKAGYRPGADPEHPLGPYYKYQVWQDGKNRSQRVAIYVPSNCGKPWKAAHTLSSWPGNVLS